jgi:hypothetical protein
MNRKYVISLVAAVLGSAALAVTTVHAEGGWGPHHGHHHGFGAAQACIVTMSPTQKAGLKQIFSSNKDTLKADFKTVKTDRENVQLAILNGGSYNGTSLSNLESTLQTDEGTLQAAKDALATTICNNANKTAALKLYTGLQSQRQSNREAIQSLFQAARSSE